MASLEDALDETKVERLDRKPSGSVSQPLWLAWVGQQILSLSPGWQTGEPRLRRTRYPVVKKGTATVRKRRP